MVTTSVLDVTSRVHCPNPGRLVEGREPARTEKAGTEGLQNLLEPNLQAFRLGRLKVNSQVEYYQSNVKVRLKGG